MDTRSTRRSATRQRLFAAAVSLVAEQGLSATTVAEIADRAGVAKGTVYYNFSGKAELFEELLRHGVELLTAGLRRAADSTAASGGSRTEALLAMIRAGLLFAQEQPDFVRLYVAELWRTRRAGCQAREDTRREVTAVVESELRAGVREGEFRAETDVPLTAAALVGMVLTAALDWQSFHPERSLEEVHAALSLLLQGHVGGCAV